MQMDRDSLMAILKGRFDYYAAQAVYKELLSSLKLEDGPSFDQEALGAMADYLARKVPGSDAVVSRLRALTEAPTTPAAQASPKDAPEADAPKEDAAPAAEAPKDDAPAPDEPKEEKKTKKKGKKKK